MIIEKRENGINTHVVMDVSFRIPIYVDFDQDGPDEILERMSYLLGRAEGLMALVFPGSQAAVDGMGFGSHQATMSDGDGQAVNELLEYLGIDRGRFLEALSTGKRAVMEALSKR